MSSGKRIRWFALLLLLPLAVGRLPAKTVDAVIVAIGDQHSAYDRTAQFVALVDRVRHENPGVPLAVLIDGDTFELGNVVAKRSGGAIEFTMFKALAQRAPTVLNLGNHEPEFYDLADTVARVQATGVIVISNAVNHATGKPFAPASTRLRLGAREAVIVGVTTDRLATYRAAVRPSLDLADPVVWAKQNFSALLHDAGQPIVMSHAGLKADRAMLPLVRDGTLFLGAHDHLQFVHREGRTLYVHSGSWNEIASVIRLESVEGGGEPRWEVEQVRIDANAEGDTELAKLISTTFAHELTREDLAVVGHTTQELTPVEAARFAVRAVRAATGADAAMIGGTTFGAGLPAGDVTRFALDASVRFDGAIMVGEVDGAALAALFEGANQGPDTPFSERRGENLVMVAPAKIDPSRRYTLATTDWGARNAKSYFGENPPVFHERAELRLKAVVAKALSE